VVNHGFAFSVLRRIEYYLGTKKAVLGFHLFAGLSLSGLQASLYFRKDVSVVDEDQDKIVSRDERRQFDRSRLIVDVYFDGSDLTGVASTTDISLGGLYLSTGVDIPKGSTLTLRIPMGRQHLVVRGDVVYSLPGHGVGVRFHRLSNEKKALMERELPAP
jgi:hypothetical protein